MNLNESSHPKTIFIALSGLSPAIITESLYCLAHEDEPVIPDKIVAITTLTGKQKIKEQLLDSGVWQDLRRELKCSDSQLQLGDQSIKVIADHSDNSMDDIITAQDNEALADYLLKELRRYMDTTNNRVIMSIAGGRKTMSVVGSLVFSIMARPLDRLCHVLCQAPFDIPALKPPFYFPVPGRNHYFTDKQTGENSTYASSQAQLVLADIPVVKTRSLFKEYNLDVDNYLNVVDSINKNLEGLDKKTAVLHTKNQSVQIGNSSFRLSGKNFAFLKALVMASQEEVLIDSENKFEKFFKAKTGEYFSSGSPEYFKSFKYDYNKAIAKSVPVLELQKAFQIKKNPGGFYCLEKPPHSFEIL